MLRQSFLYRRGHQAKPVDPVPIAVKCQWTDPGDVAIYAGCSLKADMVRCGNTDGDLTTWLRRRNGCARVTTENFQVLPDGTVLISKAEIEATGPVLESKPTTGSLAL